jgi:hypothetical protein
MLPEIARGDSNKVWIVPSELGEALKGLGSVLPKVTGAEPNGQAPTSETPPAT